MREKSRKEHRVLEIMQDKSKEWMKQPVSRYAILSKDYWVNSMYVVIAVFLKKESKSNLSDKMPSKIKLTTLNFRYKPWQKIRVMPFQSQETKLIANCSSLKSFNPACPRTQKSRSSLFTK